MKNISCKKNKFKKTYFSEYIDPLILPAVEILNSHGFDTYESCQGGEGHCTPYPFVKFNGDEYDLIKAFEVCQCYRLAVYEAKRVFIKEDIYINKGVGEGNATPIGTTISRPYNEITFVIHSNTGTIYLPS